MINILWDLDGTVIDSMPVITACMNKTVEHFGFKPWPVEELKQFVGPGLTHTMGVLLETDDREKIEAAKEYYRTHYIDLMSESPVFEGIQSALAHFKSIGANQYIATAKYQGFAKKIIEAASLNEYFTGIYGSMKDGRLSNKTELLAQLISEEGIEPGNSIMVGDTHYDIEAGRDNDMTTVGVLWGYSTREKLQQSGAHYCISAPEDLAETIKAAMACAC